MNAGKRIFVCVSDDTRRTWITERLWALAAELPMKSVPLESIAAFDQNCWFGASEPTCRNVAEHARRINDVSFDHPIILSSEGWVMDGMHRVAKAFIEGLTCIQAVQFAENPAPDECVQLEPAPSRGRMPAPNANAQA